MSENQKDNSFVMETLIKISKDVGEIKTKVEGLEKSKDKENKSFEKRIEAVEKITEQNTKDILELKNTDDRKDAKRYRKFLALLGACVSGVIIAKFPDIVRFFLVLFSIKG